MVLYNIIGLIHELRSHKAAAKNIKSVIVIGLIKVGKHFLNAIDCKKNSLNLFLIFNKSSFKPFLILYIFNTSVLNYNTLLEYA